MKMIFGLCKNLASNWRSTLIVLAVVLVILNILSSRHLTERFSSKVSRYADQQRPTSINPLYGDVSTSSSDSYTYIQTLGNIEDTNVLKNNCIKQENIIFVKVHKTGSTTMWGIFARFAQENNLNMVLPKRENGSQFNYLSTQQKIFNETIMKLPRNVSYNILCNHAVYDKDEFQKIMPRDTIRTGILRDPFSVFTSAFFYFGFNNILRHGNPNITEDLLLHRFLEKRIYLRYADYPLLSNGMSYDFGIPTSKMSNNSFVKDYIHQLDKDFKLVLITEYFDESLVLMKRYFCWDLKDIIYLPVNTGKWHSRVKPYLTDQDKDTIRNLNNADYLLYDHFKDRLFTQMSNEDDTYLAEVQHFKTIIYRFSHFCSQKSENSSSVLLIENSPWNSEFILTRYMCYKVQLPEVYLLRKIIKETKRKYFTEYESEL